MHNRARAISLALTSATLLAGSVLTAAPASAAAPGSLTAAYCAAQANGNVYKYTQAKGVKTCTITYPVVRRINADTNTVQQRFAPYTEVTPDVAALLTADGYQSDYQTSTDYLPSKTFTQKGGGAITGGFITETVVDTVISTEICQSLGLFGGTWYPTASVPNYLCADLGMYPANLSYVGS